MMVKRLCTLCMKYAPTVVESNARRMYSTTRLTNAEVRKKRSAIFEEEKLRQRSDFVKRISKIEVKVIGDEINDYMIMNKDISTPYNCAMHLGDYIMKRSIVALVDGEPWDMHRPLEDDCTVEFKHMLEEDPTLANKVFWRSGSFVLGHILETSFKEDVFVELISFPPSPIKAGCFVYDVDLKLPDWKPRESELMSLSIVGGQLHNTDWDFERLDVDASVALRMFEDNRFKLQQIPEIAEQSENNRIVVYRMKDHVDITKGPLISNSSQFGRFKVAAVNQIESDRYGPIQRVQAIALPADLQMHWWAWELLCKRAAKPMMQFPPDFNYKSIESKQTDSAAEEI